MSHADDHDEEKRDFLFYATAGVGTAAVAAGVLPLIKQMNPSADVQAASTMRVDVGAIEPGTQVTVLFQGKPVFIRRRTAEEIAEATGVPMDELIDPDARNDNLSAEAPADDANRTVAPFGDAENTGEWLVMIGLCTHFGCVPIGDGAGDFGGWFCPCHGSHYDTAGRIRKGPAPENLPVPAAEFVDETTILLG